MLTKLPFRPRQITHKQDVKTCFSCSCDNNLDPITLTYEDDLHILQMYLYNENKLSRSRLSEARELQTHRRTRLRQSTMPHLWVITAICQFAPHCRRTDMHLTQCFSTAQIQLFKNSSSRYFSQPFAVHDILNV